MVNLPVLFNIFNKGLIRNSPGPSAGHSVVLGGDSLNNCAELLSVLCGCCFLPPSLPLCCGCGRLSSHLSSLVGLLPPTTSTSTTTQPPLSATSKDLITSCDSGPTLSQPVPATTFTSRHMALIIADVMHCAL